MQIRRFASLLVLSAFVLTSLMVFPVSPADAAALSGLSDTMSSVKTGVTSSHTLRFITITGATDSTDTIIVTFPSDFNFTNKTISSVRFTHGASTGSETTETLAYSPSATAWGAAFSGTSNRVLTLTAPSDGTGAGALSAGQKVIITMDSADSVNPSTAGTYAITLSGTFGDTGTITVPILSDDQVVISADVSQTLSFSISDNTIGFGTLSSSAARYATGDETGTGTETEAHNMAVATNAMNGYTTTVQGDTLSAGSATITAIGSSNTASSAGTEQFGLRMTASGGSGAVSSSYSSSGFAYAGTATTSSEVAASATASSTTTYSVRYLANISSGTEAGSYQTTLTYVTTANF